VNEDVTRDMSWSAQAFVRFVWPVVAPWCGGGELKPVESVSASGLVRDLDVLAGIDAWQLLHDRGYMRGVASRVQDRRMYGTFTVRYRRHGDATTEFEKRRAAIRDRDAGALYPALTVQGYVADKARGPLIGAGMARTVDIIEHLAKRLTAGRAKPLYVHEVGCPKYGTYPSPSLGRGCVSGCAEFYAVDWGGLRDDGYECRTWPEPKTPKRPAPPAPENARRAAKWAAEDAAAAVEREAEAREAQRRRAAEWPLDRIRALMSEARPR
jgi:hypothetical protein